MPGLDGAREQVASADRGLDASHVRVGNATALPCAQAIAVDDEDGRASCDRRGVIGERVEDLRQRARVVEVAHGRSERVQVHRRRGRAGHGVRAFAFGLEVAAHALEVASRGRQLAARGVQFAFDLGAHCFELGVEIDARLLAFCVALGGHLLLFALTVAGEPLLLLLALGVHALPFALVLCVALRRALAFALGALTLGVELGLQPLPLLVPFAARALPFRFDLLTDPCEIRVARGLEALAGAVDLHVEAHTFGLELGARPFAFRLEFVLRLAALGLALQFGAAFRRGNDVFELDLEFAIELLLASLPFEHRRLAPAALGLALHGVGPLHEVLLELLSKLVLERLPFHRGGLARALLGVGARGGHDLFDVRLHVGTRLQDLEFAGAVRLGRSLLARLGDGLFVVIFEGLELLVERAAQLRLEVVERHLWPDYLMGRQGYRRNANRFATGISSTKRIRSVRGVPPSSAERCTIVPRSMTLPEAASRSAMLASTSAARSFCPRHTNMSSEFRFADRGSMLYVPRSVVSPSITPRLECTPHRGVPPMRLVLCEGSGAPPYAESVRPVSASEPSRG